MSSTTSPENGRSNRLTIREVADLAGVSTATVSRVINGRAEVSERARAAVLRVVREHGYSTNRTARGLSAGRTGLVGVTLPVVHHSYFSVILAGAGEALYEHDMRMVLCPTHHEHDREVSLLERLMHGTTDGALLILPEESRDELAALHDHGYRFVIVDPLRRSTSASRRCRRRTPRGRARPSSICCRSGTGGSPRSPARAAGSPPRSACAATAARSRPTGVMPDPELVIESDFHADGGVEAALSLLDLPDPPTAIFAFNDMLAIGVMQAARRAASASPRSSRWSASTTPSRPRS